MKRIIAILLLTFTAASAHAVSVYKQPTVKIYYSESLNGDSLLYAINTIMTIAVTPYGMSDVLTVQILNNTAYEQTWNISINDPATGAPSQVFLTDNGCDGLVPAKTSCTMTVTFTPPAPSADGTVQYYLQDFFIDRADGSVYKQYSIKGWYQ